MYPSLRWSRLNPPEASTQTATHGMIAVSIWQTTITHHGQLVNLAPAAVVVAATTNLLFSTNIQAMLLQSTWCVARPTAVGLRHLIRLTQDTPVLLVHLVKTIPLSYIFLHVTAYFAGYTPGASRNTQYHLLLLFLWFHVFVFLFFLRPRPSLFREKSAKDTEEGKYRRVHVTMVKGRGNTNLLDCLAWEIMIFRFSMSLYSFSFGWRWRLRSSAVVIVLMVEVLGRKELSQFGGLDLDLDSGSCFMIPMQYRERIKYKSFF